jgi:pimeloyl-CoA synthetase
MDNMNQYRDRGIKFSHFRVPTTSLDGASVQEGIHSQGGATVAYTSTADGTFAAVAYCNPKDNFNYGYGRAKAAGRLTQLMAAPEKADGDKFFADKGADSSVLLARLHDHMLEGLGYIHRGKKKPSKAGG